jgi:phosphosulfolactate synthase
MMADWGLPLTVQKDLLQLAGRYLDFAKFTTGSSRLYERSYLVDKIEHYKAAEVRPFIGGQFFEYVLANQGWAGVGPFFAEAHALGFATIEISDNCIPLDDAERARAIGAAIESGLSVMGEVGSKNETNDPSELIAQAEQCLEAGAELILVEAAELVHQGKPKRDMLSALRNGLDMDRIMIELPGPWISGVSHSLVHELKNLLVAEFGPDVNIANVHADDLLATEALRVGLGVVGPTKRLAG